MLAQATHQQCSVWRPTALLGGAVRDNELGAKFSSAFSNHNTAAKFKQNLFPSILHAALFPVTEGDLNLIHPPGIYLFIYLQAVHPVTTHPSRTCHDLSGSPGARCTQPPLHGNGQKNTIKFLMWCTQSPQKEIRICMLSSSHVTWGNGPSPLKIRVAFGPKLLPKRG